MFHNIPAELKLLRQWVVADMRPDPFTGLPTKKPLNPRTGKEASVTDPLTWGTWEEIEKCGFEYIGFVLSESDPYTFIDLDDAHSRADKTTINEGDPDFDRANEIFDRQKAIEATFESYSEISVSGKGIHIIVKGSVPKGRRRDKIEVYSKERYMICTGNVFSPLPIREAQDLLDLLYKEMQGDVTLDEVALVDTAATMSDDDLIEMGHNATNGHKFAKLWAGDWHGVAEWPSQSEADFALMSMIAYYSKDNEQCRRVFRKSGLSREKTNKSNYHLNVALKKCRAKEPPPINFDSLRISKNTIQDETPTDTADVIESNDEGASLATDESESAPDTEDGQGEASEKVFTNGLTLPPGLIGDVAEYITASAIRPVAEIGLATAIGLCAGIAGRAYNVSGVGLNQYLILLAKTGTGKEGIASGIDRLMGQAKRQMPMADRFIGPSAFASGQALVRVLDKSPSFVSVLGEFGLTLQQITDPRANSAHLMLKKVLLDVYAKSGHDSHLRPSVYSDSDKNTKTIQSPNVTILGESTPETFYRGLDATSIAEGLIPRLSIIEYTGPRTKKNPNAFFAPDPVLVNQLAELMHVAATMDEARKFTPVQTEPAALRLLDEFDEYATDEINGASVDVSAQLWNRAHLKAIKLAALVATGCNAHAPIIDLACADWAIEFVCKDVHKVLAKFQSGDVGHGDSKLEAHVRRAVGDWLHMTDKQKLGYGIDPKMLGLKVIPFQFLRRRLRLISDFRNDRRGENAALQAVLSALCEADELKKLAPQAARENLGTNAPAYALGRHWRNEA